MVLHIAMCVISSSYKQESPVICAINLSVTDLESHVIQSNFEWQLKLLCEGDKKLNMKQVNKMTLLVNKTKSN